VALLAVGATGLSGPVEQAGKAPDPHPFDPPSQAERTVAARIALQDSRIQEALADHRYVLLGVALGTEKAAGVPVSELIRLLDVWFYDYNEDVVVWAVVDSAQGHVTRIVPVDFAFQPPLVDAEIQRAKQLALGLAEVSARFPASLPATARLVSGEGTMCPNQRCALLAFIENDLPVLDSTILVNLSADRVIQGNAGYTGADQS
jgi:hypothetical protein